MIVILAIINTYYPEYLGYTFIVFIALSFVLTMLRTRTRFIGISSDQLKEIKESRKVYEEKAPEVLSAMSVDKQLAQEMKPLTRLFLINIFIIVFIMAWYYLYFSFTKDLTQSPLLPNIQKFAVFLIGYETPLVLMAVVSFRQNRLLRSLPQIPRYYTLFEKGLVGENMVIKFPLQEHNVRLDAKRGFVELLSKKVETVIRVRLYSSKPKELFESIKNYAFKG
jgi:uncharacterized membrane protein